MVSADKHCFSFRSIEAFGRRGLALLLLGLIGLVFQPAMAQSDPATLKARLKVADNDTERVNLLNELSEAWRHRNTDSAFAYARQAYDLARKVDYQHGTGEARLNQAYAFLTSGRAADAKATIAKARVDFEHRNDVAGLGRCALAEAAVQYSESAHFPALRTCLTADSLFIAGRDSLGRFRARRLMSDIFASQRAFGEASARMDEAQAMVQNDGQRARVLIRKAGYQVQEGRPAQAMASYNAALELLKLGEAYPEQAQVLNRLAALQIQLPDSASALKHLEQSLGLARKHSLDSDRADALRQLALMTNGADSSRKLMLEALAALSDTTSALRRAAFHLDMGRIWMRWPDFDLAMARADSALRWLDSVPDTALEAEVEQLRYRIFDRIGNTGRAMRSLARTTELRDSAAQALASLDAEGRRLTGRFQELMQARQHDQAMAEFRAEVQAEAQEREQYVLMGAGAMGLLALWFLLMWLRSRSRGRAARRMVKRLQNELAQADEELLVMSQKLSDVRDEVYSRGPRAIVPDPEKVDEMVAVRTRELNETVERLRDLNRELDTFMYRASHDLLGPIARLKGLVLVARGSGGDLASIQNYIGLISAVSVYLDRVLRKLIIVHELQHASRQINRINIGKVIEEITPRLSELPGISQPFILLHDELESKVQADEHLLGIVLENLLENACVFRADPDNSRPRIDVWMRRKGRDIEIELRDEGIGIPDLVREKVFDIFFRGSERSKGNGLGLYLVKMAVDLLGGRIELESEEGVFTRVVVRFPEAGQV